ncbi:MAG: hypothetical protein K2K25_11730 [Muribaculaceae bacterium]|nr:hypothetical protein [Muribaculaceae bacterium]
MKKSLSFVLSLAFCISIGAEELKTLSLGEGIPGIDVPDLAGFGISPNGRYVCGMIDSGEGVFAMDLQTGIYKYEYTEDSELHNIDNNGVGIGFLGDMGITYSWNGEISELISEDENCVFIIGEDITNDGSVKVGKLVAADYETFAAYSVNGADWKKLPEPPAEMTGAYGDGSMAIGISGDGKYIIGHAGNFGPIIVWTRNEDGSYEPDALFARYCALDESELDKKPLVDLMPQAISNNGKYILCSASKLIVEQDGNENMFTFPAVYNTDTRELKLYDEQQKIDEKNVGLTGTAIADDGSFVGIIGFMMYRVDYGCFIMKADETQAQLFLDVYPKYAEKFGISDMTSRSIPTDISADGRYILGYAYYLDESLNGAPEYACTYIIDNGESWTGVGAIESQSASEEIFSLDGVRLSELKKGVNIIRMSDGSVRKVIR